VPHTKGRWKDSEHSEAMLPGYGSPCKCDPGAIPDAQPNVMLGANLETATRWSHQKLLPWL
jgi:hypothetical protein